MDLYGYYGGSCRLPLLNLNDEDLHNLKQLFELNGFKWSSNDATLMAVVK